MVECNMLPVSVNIEMSISYVSIYIIYDVCVMLLYNICISNNMIDIDGLQYDT